MAAGCELTFPAMSLRESHTKPSIRRSTFRATVRSTRTLRMSAYRPGPTHARAKTQQRGKSVITPEVLISRRLAEVVDRAVPGH